MNQESSAAKNVGILLFDGVQVTDFTGPYDVFVLARPAGTSNPMEAPPLFRVFSVTHEMARQMSRPGHDSAVGLCVR